MLASGLLRSSSAKVALPEGLQLADDSKTLLDARGNPMQGFKLARDGSVVNTKGHPLPPGGCGMALYGGIDSRGTGGVLTPWCEQ
jgi:hypothetical protein